MTTLKIIDPSRVYTCGGHLVVNLEIVLHNSAGRKVTYPVKGTVLIGARRKDYRIWSINGQADVIWGHGENLFLTDLT